MQEPEPAPALEPASRSGRRLSEARGSSMPPANRRGARRGRRGRRRRRRRREARARRRERAYVDRRAAEEDDWRFPARRWKPVIGSFSHLRSHHDSAMAAAR